MDNNWSACGHRKVSDGHYRIDCAARHPPRMTLLPSPADARSLGLCDCMSVSFDPRERSWVSDGGGRAGCNGGRHFEVLQDLHNCCSPKWLQAKTNANEGCNSCATGV